LWALGLCGARQGKEEKVEKITHGTKVGKKIKTGKFWVANH
jgi:hypothetical protein